MVFVFFCWNLKDITELDGPNRDTLAAVKKNVSDHTWARKVRETFILGLPEITTPAVGIKVFPGWEMSQDSYF